MEPAIAIIGGTGIGDRLVAEAREPLTVRTRYGLVRGRIWPVGSGAWVISRHSDIAKRPPHQVNYRAMAQAMRDLGVRHVLATAAVGSFHAERPPGSLAVCTDVVDASGRQVTRYTRQLHHTSAEHLIDPGLADRLRAAALITGVDFAPEAVYLNVDGPRFETPAEIRAFRSWGVDVVGMTAGSEAIAMAEAGIAYGLLGMITNLAVGMQPLVSHELNESELRTWGDRAIGVLRATLEAWSPSA